MAGARPLDARPCGARARGVAGPQRCGARRDARGVGSAVDRRLRPSRTFRAAGFEPRAALAPVLRAEPRFSSARRRRISWCRADREFPSTTWTARCRRCPCAFKSCSGSRPRRRVAGGRLPLLLKLLSPAGRPVQITRDLVSFWKQRLPRGEKGSQGPLPQALLAGGSLLCAAHTTDAPPLSRRA